VRAVSFGQDGNVTLESLHDRYERELGNDLGNLLSRTTAMVARYRDGEVPLKPWDDSPVRAVIEKLRSDLPARFDAFDLTGALDQVWEQLVRGLNRYVEQQAPWVLAKDANQTWLDETLYDLVEGLRVAAVLLYPFIPNSAESILRAIGQPLSTSWDQVAYGLTVDAHVEAAPPLFPRVDAATTAA
jgi:methionyl-tRNA synthetase